MARNRDKRSAAAEGPRILFTAPRYHTNQVEAVKALQDRGCEVGYFALYEGPTEDHARLQPVVLGDCIGFRATWQVLRRAGAFRLCTERDFRIRWGCPPPIRLWRAMRGFNPDVIIVRLAAFPFAVLSLVFGVMQSARIVLYSQQPLYGPHRKRRLLFGKMMYRLAGAQWMTPVRGDPDRYPAWSERAHYVPFVAVPGAGSEHRLSMADGIEPRRVKILSIGKFEPRKNLSLMVDAFADAREGCDATLTIVGECSSAVHTAVLESLEARIRTRRLENAVDVRVNVPFGDMETLYSSHHVFVLPSSQEPAAVSVLEAMAQGLPVVCSDSNGTKSYIEQGGNGFVFKSDDVDDLTWALRRILEDPGYMERMGRRSLELVLSEHSPDRYHRRILEIAGLPCEASRA